MHKGPMPPLICQPASLHDCTVSHRNFHAAARTSLCLVERGPGRRRIVDDLRGRSMLGAIGKDDGLAVRTGYALMPVILRQMNDRAGRAWQALRTLGALRSLNPLRSGRTWWSRLAWRAGGPGRARLPSDSIGALRPWDPLRSGRTWWSRLALGASRPGRSVLSLRALGSGTAGEHQGEAYRTERDSIHGDLHFLRRSHPASGQPNCQSAPAILRWFCPTAPAAP